MTVNERESDLMRETYLELAWSLFLFSFIMGSSYLFLLRVFPEEILLLLPLFSTVVYTLRLLFRVEGWLIYFSVPPKEKCQLTFSAGFYYGHTGSKILPLPLFALRLFPSSQSDSFLQYPIFSLWWRQLLQSELSGSFRVHCFAHPSLAPLLSLSLPLFSFFP